MNFEAYLITKKIDAQAFRAAETHVWEAWQSEFEQVHPNSFTAQKLYLINPIRRKYPLKETRVLPNNQPQTETAAPVNPEANLKPKPVMRPKPKIS
ncbi:MAG: hypothetical protein JNM57_17125 [Cyclobacteriaceae bacterium]|nr:hypothetical protein [Cyclobacteriaceae bacterium]